MLDEAIADLLVNAATLSGLVNGRVYPDTVPQSVTLPAVAYSIISDIPETAHDGSAPNEYGQALVQVDLWDVQRQGCAQMRDALRRDLNGFRGEAAGLRLTAVVTGITPDFSPELRLKRYIVEMRVQYGNAS
jgi:hypothetical protein